MLPREVMRSIDSESQNCGRGEERQEFDFITRRKVKIGSRGAKIPERKELPQEAVSETRMGLGIL